MWRRVALVAGVIFTLLFFSAPVLAQSIAASPGKIIAEDVPLGQKIFLHEVEIINDSDTSHAYSIYTKKPGIIKEGYEEIPDPGWIELDKNEIEVKAQSRKPVEVWVRIPNNTANANKDYEGWVVAREKAGGMVAIEVAVRVLLSTSDFDPSLPEEDITVVSPPTEEATTEPTSEPTVESTTSPEVNSSAQPESLGTSEFPILPIVGIAAVTLIAITLIITLVRRRRY